MLVATMSSLGVDREIDSGRRGLRRAACGTGLACGGEGDELRSDVSAGADGVLMRDAGASEEMDGAGDATAEDSAEVESATTP